MLMMNLQSMQNMICDSIVQHQHFLLLAKKLRGTEERTVLTKVRTSWHSLLRNCEEMLGDYGKGFDLGRETPVL